MLKNKDEIKKENILKKSSFNMIEVVIIMIITLIFGGLLGSALTFANYRKKSISTVLKPKEELAEFIETYNEINNNYYTSLDKKALLDSAIKGMFDYLKDDYSLYMNKEETEKFNQTVNGEYVGIGVEISRKADNLYRISQVFQDGPAYKVGIKVGDIIDKVNGIDIKAKPVDETLSMIRGESGTEVTIGVLRNNHAMSFKIIRKSMDIKSVHSKKFMLNDKSVGYLKISVFANNTDTQFKKALEELENSNISSLIIDVRYNSGGYLNVTKNIISNFLSNDKVIYKLDTKGIVEEIKSHGDGKRKYPIVVLTNSYSASASEILAAALNESYGAEIVGTNTFGKGTVQKAHSLSSGGSIKYTIQKWLTPMGNWINKVGVKPTKHIELNEKFYTYPTEENDNQLQEALKILKNK